MNPSQTGRYVWDPGTQQLVKVSDKVPVLHGDLRNGVWWPKGESQYFDRQANRTFHSKSDKVSWMRKAGVVEFQPTWKNPLKGLPEQGKWKPTRHKGVLHV